ncbi:MAG TPA: hypothetical protein PKY77_09025 [Phycisphaerae bacterium]|nr:hypothetical protein [Phycisphaerae bacterium]HRY68398.1 hypothetical protein [Phycisphaerae bacterium]HSA27815.1 hypothetical protein [Phycisphaerae bacterium]
MTNRRLVGEWLPFVFCALVVGSLGADCASLIPDTINSDPVTVELVNYGAYSLDPRLYVSPSQSIGYDGELLASANHVAVTPAVASGETVTLVFNCADIGTITTDHAELYLTSSTTKASDNGPWLVQDQVFSCGDTITFIYIDDDVDGFYTRVEVNDTFLED